MTLIFKYRKYRAHKSVLLSSINLLRLVYPLVVVDIYNLNKKIVEFNSRPYFKIYKFSNFLN